jgi:hypothetical protein
MDEIELPLRCHARRFLLGSYWEWKSGQEELGQTPGGDHGTDALLEALARCACRGRAQAHDPEEGRRFLKRHAPVRRRLPRGRGEVMNAIALSCITFVCILGGALLGMLLPGHRLSAEDKDVVRLGTGLIGTICPRAGDRGAKVGVARADLNDGRIVAVDLDRGRGVGCR